MHGDGDADAGVGARQLLEHEHVRDEVGAGAAVLLRHADAEQPELGQRCEQLPREPVRAIPLGGVRLDLGAGEVARERLDLALLRRQLEVHGRRLSAMRSAVLLGALVAVTGCGGSGRALTRVGRARVECGTRPQPTTRPPRRLFADGAQVIQAGAVRLDDPRRRGPLEREPRRVGGADHLASSRRAADGDVLAVFVLTRARRRHRVRRARAACRRAVLGARRDGSTLWHQTNPPPASRRRPHRLTAGATSARARACSRRRSASG